MSAGDRRLGRGRTGGGGRSRHEVRESWNPAITGTCKISSNPGEVLGTVKFSRNPGNPGTFGGPGNCKISRKPRNPPNTENPVLAHIGASH